MNPEVAETTTQTPTSGVWFEVEQVQIDDQFDVIIEHTQWWDTLALLSAQERLPHLLAAPPGVDLMDELRMINPDELDEEHRLILGHLWERCVGWVQAQAAQVDAGFVDALKTPDDQRPYIYQGEPVVTGVGLREIGVAIGMSEAKTAMRVIAGRALAPDGCLADTGAALRAGRISWEVASAFVDATWTLDNDKARAVQDRVLPRAVAPINPETGTGCWVSKAWAVKQLRRAVIAVDTDTVIKQREEARRRRRVYVTFEHNTGMAYLTAYLPAAEAVEIYNTLNTLADDQRRQDAITHPDERPRAWDTARADALVLAVRAALESLSTHGTLPTVHGKPRVELGVIIDLPTLLNMADHPGELLGYGPIDAEYARLLGAEAEHWRRWVLEPVTGHLIDLGRTKYKPSQELRDYILAAYPECTTPECGRHSLRADIDHAQEWHDDGPTAAANLHVLCRRDHVDKTLGETQVQINDDGTVTHTTKHGLSRTSEPYWKSFADDLIRDQDEVPPF